MLAEEWFGFKAPVEQRVLYLIENAFKILKGFGLHFVHLEDESVRDSS